MPLKSKTKLDVKAIVEAEVDKFVVYQVRGIEKVVVREEQRGGKPTRILQTQGINLEVRGTLLLRRQLDFLEHKKRILHFLFFK